MTILFFAAHSQIWKHAFPEALVAEALQQQGHRVVYITCGEALNNHCIPIISTYMKPDAPSWKKKLICNECKRNASILRKSFGFEGYDLVSVLDREDLDLVNDIVKSANQQNYRSITIEGIKIGQLALYQVMLRYKQAVTDSFSDQAWAEYLAQLEITAKAFYGLKKIFAKEKPDRTLAYNGLYSVNSVFRTLSEKLEVPFYFLHAGLNFKNRLQTLILAKSQTLDYVKALISTWETRFSEIPGSATEMRQVTDNFMDIMGGNSFMAYSTSQKTTTFDIRKQYNIPAGSKIIVAIMSSYDEFLAADAAGAYKHDITPIFASQIDWLKVLFDFFAKREDLFLIVRVHPREFPTKREGVKSQHAIRLESELKTMPKNVIINWPSEGVSLYDLAEETNLFVNAFSTAAREMMLLGRPVLTYRSEDVVEPVSIMYKGKSIPEYLAHIDTLLTTGFDVERIRKGYRWRAAEQVTSHIDISDSYDHKDDMLTAKDKLNKVVGKLRDVINPGWEQRSDCKKRAKVLGSADTIIKMIESGADCLLDIIDPLESPRLTVEEETLLLKSEVKKLIKQRYQNDETIKPNTLKADLYSFANANL